MKNIQDRLKNLTPQQKLQFLEPLVRKKKGNEKNQILTLIKEVEQEQTILEESIRKLESSRPREEHTEGHPEEPLETIVEEEAASQAQKKEEKPSQLYGAPPTPQDIYGTEKIQTKYLSLEERKDKEYKSQPDFTPENRFSREEESLINQEKRLEKEKKKYETGVS